VLNKKALNYIKLGASLYVPATRTDLKDIAELKKIRSLRSMIICTEDSVRHCDLNYALDNVSNLLCKYDKPSNILIYIRVRSPDILKSCLQMNRIDKVNGFVLPKINRNNLRDYLGKFTDAQGFEIMPTLETKEVFDNHEMVLLRDLLLNSYCSYNIASLRIGGNDILNHLHIRRHFTNTAYNTPLQYVISSLVSIFKPYGFNLTGPVFEGINDAATLAQEVLQDLQHGLFGKSAIHPDHVPIIENQYQVLRHDLEMAEAILSDDASAVFSMHGLMCEPSTHKNWAYHILERSRHYGVL